ncbi:MAG: hypothetical protein ACREJ3_14095, partial [Polyangiaceae bacterium]
WAAPFVLAVGEGRVEVSTGGVTHVVRIGVDRIAQRPLPRHDTREDGLVRIGSEITICCPRIASSLAGPAVADSYTLGSLLKAYAAFNPHASFDSDGIRIAPRADPEWRKWRPSDPTSAHWYTEERFRALIAAHVSAERDGRRPKTVREFLAEFDGLRGSAKQKAVAAATGLTGATLRELVRGGDLDPGQVTALLRAAQDESRPVKPAALGVLGDHLRDHLLAHRGVARDSVRAKRLTGVTAAGLPYVLEVALGVHGEDGAVAGRVVATGLNFSPSLRSDVLPRLPWLLGVARVDPFDPVCVLVHLVCPALDYTNGSKSRLALPPEIDAALEQAVASVTKAWKAAKRRADREDRIQRRDLDELRRANAPRPCSIKIAAYEAMAAAYGKASANGTLPANARQIMYAARPSVLERTGGRSWKSSSYFTQHLLPD